MNNSLYFVGQGLAPAEFVGDDAHIVPFIKNYFEFCDS